MAIAVVQHIANTSVGSPTCAKAYGSSVTTPHLLCAEVLVLAGSGMTIGVADSQGNTWTGRPQVAGTSGVDQFRQFIAPAIAATGACTVTATVTGGTPTAISMQLWELSGAQTGTTFDSGNLTADAFANGTSTTPTTLSVTPSINGCIVLGHEVNALGGVATAGSGYTLADSAPTTNAAGVYQIQTTATATAPTVNIGAANWEMVALIIQPFVAAGASWGPQLSDSLNRIVVNQ